MVNKNVAAQQKTLMNIIIGLGFLVAVLVAIMVFQKNASAKPVVKKQAITSGAKRIDPKELWIDNIEVERKIQTKRLDSLQKTLEAVVKGQEALNTEVLSQAKEQAERKQQDSQPALKANGQASANPSSEFLGSLQGSQSQEVSQQVNRLEGLASEPVATVSVRKISVPLIARNSKKDNNLKTIDNTIPSGAFAQAVLIGGVDASTSIQASSNPQPVLLRITTKGNLPRRFSSDLKGCRVLAATYGDLSSERVNMRLERMSCIERKTGEVIDIKVSGYVAGEDGRAGLRGTVVDKAGPIVRNAAIGGFLGGISSLLGGAKSPVTFSPMSGLAQTNPLSTQAMLKQGASKGAANALEKYADFYIKRAEQLQPVIQVQAGRVVDIVFTEGVDYGQGKTRAAISRANDKSRYQQLKTIQKSAGTGPVEAWIPGRSSAAQ